MAMIRDHDHGWRALTKVAATLFLLLISSGCSSLKRVAANSLADALAGSGDVFSSDDDPQLVRDAVPFSLKLMESVLSDTPNHAGLLLSTSRSFTQYAYAFLIQDADELETRDIAAATALRDRARKLLLRARGYGLRGLDVAHPGMSKELIKSPRTALRIANQQDVPQLYWTAAAWGAAITISKNDPNLVADQSIFEALIDRALELDESYDYGAIHALLISYEPSRQGAATPAEQRSRTHFQRAVELSGGQSAGPYVALAEAISLQKQDKKEFESLMNQALAIDVNARPQWRLQNLVAQKRAKWLSGRMSELFVE